MTDTPRKIAVIAALDVAGYSAKTEADEARTTTEVAALKAVIEEIAARHSGRVFNTAGDGFMLEFGSSLSAVEAAFELAETCEPKVRVGVHLGDVVVQANGDLLGHGVNVAARLMAQAIPGTVLVSADVQRSIRGPLAQSLRSKGTVKLAKMAEAIEVFALVPDAAVKRDLTAQFRNLWAKRKTVSRTSVAIVGAAFIAMALAASWSLLAPRNVQPSLDATIPEASVAVLPFENLSPDKNNAFFASGIQDEILTRLAKIGSLKVISRTSTSHFASRPENLPEIAKQLGVANILEGSVQREGDAVRVNVQLIRASTDDHLWAEIYDRKLDNIFSVQSDIAIAIANALSAKVTGEEAELVAAKPTNNTEAYDAYLRGLAQFQAVSLNSDAQATILFKRSVTLDPQFALAWAWLSRSEAKAYFLGDQTAEHKAAARESAAEAFRLRPDLPEVQLTLGFLQYWIDRDFAGARRRFEQAQLRSPNDIEIPFALGRIARRQGRWEEALSLLEQARSLDPLRHDLRSEIVNTLVAMRKFSEALSSIESALNLWPESRPLLSSKLTVLDTIGKTSEADPIFRMLLQSSPHEVGYYAIANHAALVHKYDEAITSLQWMMKATSDTRIIGKLNALLGDLFRWSNNSRAAKDYYEKALKLMLPQVPMQANNADLLSDLAFVYLGLDQSKKAFEYLDEAMAAVHASQDQYTEPAFREMYVRMWARLGDHERAIAAIPPLLTRPASSLSPVILRLDPDFDKLRGDPRFEALAHSDEAHK